MFRWFVGLPIDAAIWHPTVFSHNRDRLMAADVAQEFLAALMGLAQVKALLSDDHFKADDVTGFVGDLRARKVPPHIAVSGTVSKRGVVRKTAVDAATRSSEGYAISQHCRKRIEEVFGWIKAAAGVASVKVRGKPKVAATFTLAIAA